MLRQMLEGHLKDCLFDTIQIYSLFANFKWRLWQNWADISIICGT